MEIIAFANQKGGVGKTTTAVSLAACLAEKGLKMLLVDFDPQSNATSAVGVGRQPGHSAYPALIGEGKLKDEIRPTPIKNLDLIPSELDLAGAEVDIARSDNYLHCFKNVLSALMAETDYDYIFIDCPPSLGILTSNALMAAEGVIIPVQCEYLALEGLSMITDLINMLAGGGNARLRLEGIVMTMFDGRTNLSADVVAEVKKHFGDLVYKTCIPRSVRISEAPSYGQPITAYDPHSSGAAAYRALAGEFIKRHKPQSASAPKISKAGAQGALTSRERLRRCFFNEELDRPGVHVRTGFPDKDPSYDELKRFLETHGDLKASWSPDGLTAKPPAETAAAPHTAEFDRRIVRLQTPQGPLQATHLVSRTGQPGLQEEFFIKSRADAEKYLSLPEPEIAGAVDSFFEADRRLGERGIVQVGFFNPAGFVAELTGSETFAAMSVSDRDVLHALCERRMQSTLRVIKYLVERKVGPYFAFAGEEYIVPPLHGPEDFKDFIVRYDRPIMDLIHDAGGRVHIHCHGRVKNVFSHFVEMGTDVLHPFEAPPMGDITAAEAKALARGKMCLEGNIQIAAMYEKSPDEIRAETAALIRDAFGDRKGLIVCPTASPYIRGAGQKCLGQFKAMVDTVRNWRA